jgi:hypothetical protein
MAFFDALDADLDTVALAIGTQSVERRSSEEVRLAVADVERRLRHLQAANAALGQQLNLERVRFGGLIGSDPAFSGSSAAEVAKLRRELLQARADLEKARADLEHAQSELAAVYNTFTMRTIQPARRIYSRLRDSAR